MSWRILCSIFIFAVKTASISAVDEFSRVVCPVPVQTSTKTLEIDDNVRRYVELSGLAFSPTQVGPSGKPILFGVNDGGGFERMGVWDSGNGKLLLTLTLPNNNVTNIDWEGMVIGSCGTTGLEDSCIYIGDFGDNTGRETGGKRSRRNASIPYRIIKIREPDWKLYNNNGLLPERDMSVLPYNYLHPSSPTRFADCETLFIDHTGWGKNGAIGDLYVVTKWGADRYGDARVFKIPASVWPDKMNMSYAPLYSPRAVGSYANGNALSVSGWWTRGAMSYDGTVITLGNTVEHFNFLRCPGSTVAETLASPNPAVKHCSRWGNPAQGQVETFAWMPDGSANVEVPEGRSGALGVSFMSYDLNLTKQVCPTVGYVNGVCTNLEVNASMARLPDAWCDAFLGDTSAPSVSPTTLPPTAVPTTRQTSSTGPTNVFARPTVQPGPPSNESEPVGNGTPLPTPQPSSLMDDMPSGQVSSTASQGNSQSKAMNIVYALMAVSVVLAIGSIVLTRWYMKRTRGTVKATTKDAYTKV